MNESDMKQTDELQVSGDRIAGLLDSAGLSYQMKRLRGEADSISIRLPGGLQIWVYETGMEVLRDKLDRRFEVESFSSHEEMREGFDRELRAVLAEDDL